MRTTVRLSDGLLKQAKKYAAEHETTLTSMLDQGLRLVLREKPGIYNVQRKKFRLKTDKGNGVLPGVDLSCTSKLLDRLDGL